MHRVIVVWECSDRKRRGGAGEKYEKQARGRSVEKGSE